MVQSATYQVQMELIIKLAEFMIQQASVYQNRLSGSGIISCFVSIYWSRFIFFCMEIIENFKHHNSGTAQLISVN